MTTAAIVDRRDALPWLAFTGLLAALVVAHRAPLAGMVELWNRSPMYSYGYVVPAISAYLAWALRDRLAALPLAPAIPSGLAASTASMTLLVAAEASGAQILAQIGFVIGVVGCALLVFGAARVRAAWIAFAYLLLMVPLWDAFTDGLHAPFQNLSASIGAALIDLAGIPAAREGTFLRLPGITLEVARACSGINYLVAVLALGVPLTYLNVRGVWRRVGLIAVALVTAALSNGLRVALIGVLAHWNIGSPLHGPGHVLHGLFVAGIGHVVLFAGVAWMRDRHPGAPTGAGAPDRTHSAASTRQAWVWAAATAAVFLAVPAVTTARGADVALAVPLDALPRELGRWYVDPFAATPPAPASWQPDASLSRRYRTVEGRAADVYVGYYRAQRQDHELVSFRTADLHREAVRLEVTAPGATFPVNVVTAPGRSGGRVTLFWYELDGDMALTAGAAKMRTVWNAVVRGRSNGAVVLISSEVRDGRVDGDLLELAARVHEGLGPSLPGRVRGAPADARAARRGPA